MTQHIQCGRNILAPRTSPRLAGILLLACGAGLFAACAEDGVELNDEEAELALVDEVDQDDVIVADMGEDEALRQAGTTLNAEAHALSGGETSALASTQAIFVRGRKGSDPIILCRVPAEPVTYSNGQLTFAGQITCGTKMAAIEITRAATFYKTSSSGSSYYAHGTTGFLGRNTDRKSYYDYTLCRSGSKTIWWGGAVQFKLTWPEGWTAVAGTGYTVNGRVASGTVNGGFTPYSVGCK